MTGWLERLTKAQRIGIAWSAVALLLVAFRVNDASTKPTYEFVGAVSRDSLWLDVNQQADEGSAWTALVSTAASVDTRGITVDCAAQRVTGEAPAPALAADILRVACPIADSLARR